MSTHHHYKKSFYRNFYRAGTFEILSRLRGWVGSGVAYGIARAISQIYTATHGEVLEVVRDNLSLLQPGGPVSKTSAARVFENFARVLTDYFSLHRQPPHHAIQMCPHRHGEHVLQEVHRQRKGAILATAHFGFFELGSALLANLEIPFTILTLPESTDSMTAWRAQFRAHWGAQSITIGSDDPFSSLEVVRALQQGRFVAMLVDRPLDQYPVMVETPGGRTAFSLAAAVLANLAQCPIIPVAIWKTDTVYQLHTDEPIWISLHHSITRQSALEEATQKIARSLLSHIIEAPEQWYQFIPVRVST